MSLYTFPCSREVASRLCARAGTDVDLLWSEGRMRIDAISLMMLAALAEPGETPEQAVDRLLLLEEAEAATKH